MAKRINQHSHIDRFSSPTYNFPLFGAFNYFPPPPFFFDFRQRISRFCESMMIIEIMIVICVPTTMMMILRHFSRRNLFTTCYSLDFFSNFMLVDFLRTALPTPTLSLSILFVSLSCWLLCCNFPFLLPLIMLRIQID